MESTALIDGRDTSWSPRAYFTSFVPQSRLVEVLILAILNFFLYNGLVHIPQNAIEPPQTTLVGSDGSVNIIRDSDHDYPLFIGGTPCYALDFEICQSTNPTGDCCINAVPFETVSREWQYYFVLPLPALILLIRAVILKLRAKLKNRAAVVVSTTPGPQDLGWHYFVGLLMCSFLVQTALLLIKSFVGYPRPNYFALVAYSNLHDSPTYAAEAGLSLPSGHAAFALASGAFLARAAARDLGRRRRRRLNDTVSGTSEKSTFGEGWQVLVVYLFLVGGAVWVGCTRIRDFFHSPADVLAGFAIGALSANIAFVHFVPNDASFEFQRPRLNTTDLLVSMMMSKWILTLYLEFKLFLPLQARSNIVVAYNDSMSQVFVATSQEEPQISGFDSKDPQQQKALVPLYREHQKVGISTAVHFAKQQVFS